MIVLMACVYSVLNLCSTAETNSGSRELSFDFAPRFFSTSSAFHPSAVMIVYDKPADNVFRVVCTGSLISAEWILTAAQCLVVEDVNFIRLYAGYDSTQEALDNPSKGQMRLLESPMKHPEYRPSKQFNYDEDDLACLKVTIPFLITDRVNIVKVSTAPLKLKEEHFCSVTGYCRGKSDIQSGGRSYSSNEIRDRSVTVTPKCYCTLAPSWVSKVSDKITQRAPFICDNHRRTRELSSRLFCEGDTGAGLMCKGLLYGVFTALLNSSFHDRCAKDATEPIFQTEEDTFPKNTFTIAFVEACTHIKWINGHAKIYWPNAITEGGCGRLEDSFTKDRAKIKDPKIKYWGEETIEEEVDGVDSDEEEDGKKGGKEVEEDGEDEGGEKDEEDEEGGEDEEYSGVTRAAQSTVLFALTILVPIIR